MSRRTNLNTVRSEFSWSSHWSHIRDHAYLSLQDLQINAYLTSLFYSLKIPTSNYTIRRFTNTLVIIETDLFITENHRFIHFVALKYYYFGMMKRLNKWTLHMRKRALRIAIHDFTLLTRVTTGRRCIDFVEKWMFGLAPRVLRIRRRRDAWKHGAYSEVASLYNLSFARNSIEFLRRYNASELRNITKYHFYSRLSIER